MNKLKIAVIGSGISGLSAAWLLSKKHDVTLFEANERPGGHTHTNVMDVDGKPVPVDTGFICFNDATYPNLIALFDHLGVETSPTVMSFAASMGDGAYEYAGGTWLGMAAQPANALRAGHWRMISDILRFFRTAGKTMNQIPDDETLSQYINREGYSQEFKNRHLLPMAAAIWSSKMGDMNGYPARSFIRFFHNHGLLKLYHRPLWRSVLGGSQRYVDKLLADSDLTLRCDYPIERIERLAFGVRLFGKDGQPHQFDQVVVATHADQALAMLADPTEEEREHLGAFSYSSNRAVLHRDRRFMPKRRLAWASWNYMDWQQSGPVQARSDQRPPLCVSYWMNRLQKLQTRKNIFVTLNPPEGMPINDVAAVHDYTHPVFDKQALRAQRRIWGIQGENRTWYCGAHFGAGFHEDGLQAGLAVAEQLGGVRRPWTVTDESGRIILDQPTGQLIAAE